ncbi:TIGR03085 family metal-binding protein [Williamsia herbipolensis]|uniref:TIGR03085 family metal-binding protein n=1 Tax=Williamsia herbipolensis TaxID=1603258 RepID=UPI0005F7F55D|nr:TIGR03085 family metal-binding protein [Williamsia herbipolensis]
MTAARTERTALAETLRSVGPDAPTLCDGWTARDLTAHMVVREARLDASAGIVIPPLAGYTEHVQNSYARRDYGRLVDQFASGPPWYSPFAVLDRFANPAEFFVHHEDVRRASPGWTPRVLDPALESALMAPLKMIGKKGLRSAGARVALTTGDGATVLTAGSGPSVTVTGDLGDLVLFVFGRDQLDLAFDGDPDAVAAVKAAERGL